MYAPLIRLTLSPLSTLPGSPQQEQEIRLLPPVSRKVRHNFDTEAEDEVRSEEGRRSPPTARSWSSSSRTVCSPKDDAWFKERDGWFLSITDGIEFGDPKIVADNDGYCAALDAFWTRLYTDAKRAPATK